MNKLQKKIFLVLVVCTIIILWPLISYVYVDGVCEHVPYLAKRKDAELRIWLFMSSKVTLDQMPSAWRPIRIYTSGMTIVRYKFVLMPQLEFYLMYDQEDRMVLRIPAYE